jgi:hypothetical protein
LLSGSALQRGLARSDWDGQYFQVQTIRFKDDRRREEVPRYLRESAL